MAVFLSPIGNGFNFLDENGRPLNEGRIYTYLAGTSTPAATYTTSVGNVENDNPIELGVDGRPPNEIWFSEGVTYKFILRDSLDNLIDTYDDLPGINDSTGGGSPTFTDVTINNNLTVEGDTTLEGDLTVLGDTTFEGDVVFEGDVDLPDGSVTITDLSEEVLNLIFNSGGGGGGSGQVTSGDGRLSLLSGVKVMTTDVEGALSVYYVGGLILNFNDGSDTFQPFLIGELVQELSDTNYSPAASVANKTYDMFGWKDTLSVTQITRSGSTATATTSTAHNITTGAIVFITGATQGAYNGYKTLLSGSGSTFTFSVDGTPATPATGVILAATARLSRGQPWRNAGQVITDATFASPIVVTANSHGLENGDEVVIGGVGGNTEANGTHTVANKTANTFELAGTTGNAAYISGTGFLASRGNGAATAEIELIGTTYLNAVAITNGPAANMGTYLGSIHTDASNELDWFLGGAALGGSPAYLSVFNASNRVQVLPIVNEGTDDWTYNSNTVRAMNNSNDNRVSFLLGLPDLTVQGRVTSIGEPQPSNATAILIGLNSTSVPAPGSNYGNVATGMNNTINGALISFYQGTPGMGFQFLQAQEVIGGTISVASTFFGAATAYGPTLYGSSISAILEI